MSKFDLDKYGISPVDIKNEVDHLQSEIEVSPENIGLFTLKTANDWMEQAKGRPIPKMLFGEFWFEGEICILFADTNLGKSILAVQISDSISRGVPVGGFKFESEKQKVIYLDFELSEKQFESRYSVNYEDHYTFDDNFFRVEINPDADIPDKQSFEDFLHDSLEQLVLETKAKVIIVDNITYLSSETEKAKDALPLMKKIKALKNKYGLSMLILAHTPKRDTSKQITHNDLQGSKMLINFCDSSFAMTPKRNNTFTPMSAVAIGKTDVGITIPRRIFSRTTHISAHVMTLTRASTSRSYLSQFHSLTLKVLEIVSKVMIKITSLHT